MYNDKSVLTTGEVAKICCVAPRTVSKWFDAGQLRGYRIPGSKDRRIPIDQLISFMRANGIPLNGLGLGQLCMLVVDDDPEFARSLAETLGERNDYETHVAACVIEAGALANQYKPNAILVDVGMPDVVPERLARWVRSDPGLRHSCLIAIGRRIDDGKGHALLQIGFDAYICKPFGAFEVTEVLESCSMDGGVVADS